MEALLYLGVNPSQHVLVKRRRCRSHGQHGLVNISSDDVVGVVARVLHAADSRLPRLPQGIRFSGKCSPEVSIVAPSTPAPVSIDLNAMPVADGSSSGDMRKRQCEMPADMFTGARNLFDEMPTDVDDDTANRFLENMIFEDQVGLDGFPLDHEVSEDYGLEEEDDDMDIDGEPLFEEELANQTVVGAKLKHESKRTKAYMPYLKRRRFEMDAERQAKMLELVEAKQAKMLEIEVTNARTKAQEVALASMETGAEIMKVDLNTVSRRKRLWFEKMQAEMFKFDQL
ncbi:DNA repair protein rhp54 [Hordeum vulgare]|nr:DNA repair protein rhp54 [Hordeum vulgare]